MDGRWCAIHGGLVATRAGAREKDVLQVLAPVNSCSIDERVPSAQYCADTFVTFPLPPKLWDFGRNPMKNKTLASAVVDLAA
jgi:hypothetical protein